MSAVLLFTCWLITGICGDSATGPSYDRVGMSYRPHLTRRSSRQHSNESPASVAAARVTRGPSRRQWSRCLDLLCRRSDDTTGLDDPSPPPLDDAIVACGDLQQPPDCRDDRKVRWAGGGGVGMGILSGGPGRPVAGQQWRCTVMRVTKRGWKSRLADYRCEVTTAVDKSPAERDKHPSLTCK